ncbi:oligosaccharide flippase family protein [Thermodesulfobacteriota bacterium]
MAKSTLWTFTGYGANQALRLGSNLILTRLLVPEIFGLGALINTFIMGLNMFSDIGIGPSIIQNRRGEELLFLNTAWTIQVLRGVAIWLGACIFAWPFAHFYSEQQLGWLISVSGITGLIAGFNSTGIFTTTRRLMLKRLTLIEIGTHLLSIVVIIVWVLISPTIWAFVAGSITSTSFKMLASHLFLSDFKHKFIWDKNSARSLARFGRWIFISTVLGYFALHIDRLVLGKFLSLKELGVYSIALMIANSVKHLFQNMSHRILLPLYSKLKEIPDSELRRKVLKLRIRLLLIFMPILFILLILGQDLITFLYDPRYQEAGWMLQTLSAGIIILIGTALGPIVLSFGDSYLHMKLIAVKVFFIFSSMLVGGHYFGTNGVIIGVACSSLFYYPIQSIVYLKYSVWFPFLDAIVIFLPILIVFVVMYFQLSNSFVENFNLVSSQLINFLKDLDKNLYF